MLGYYNYTVIPTYIGLASAVSGIYAAVRGRPALGIFCLLVSGLCDMFDGRIARTRERSDSEKRFGIQIDSLCDLVCFGVLPAVIGVSIGMKRLYYIPVLVLFVLCALIRLAYFNVREEERQQETTACRKEYEGLPVTTVALLLPLLYTFRQFMDPAYFTPLYAAALGGIAIAFISPFKVKKPGLRGLMLLLLIGILELALLIVSRSWRWL